MAGHELVLDPQIRNWVLLPILLIMVLVTLLRTFLQQLMKGTKKADIKNAALKNTLMRAKRLRANGRFVSQNAFSVRKLYFLGDKPTKVRGALKKKGLPTAANQSMAMMGPGGGMMDGMKNNMMFMVSNMVMMGWISYFFSGFILIKMPFPLTVQFKTMLQRGISLASLDSSYVSTLSWYFIVMFGLRGVLSLVMGNNNPLMDETKMMQMQMGMGGAGGMGFDAKKLYKAEADSLHVSAYKSALDETEQTLIRRYRARH